MGSDENDLPGSRSQLVDEIIQGWIALARAKISRDVTEWLQLDIPMSQMRVLIQLYLGGKANMARLAGVLGVKLPTVTGLVDRLVERGLVQREDSPDDRRLVVIRLSDHGEAVIKGIFELHIQEAERYLQVASIAELEAINVGIETLNTVVGRYQTVGAGQHQTEESGTQAVA